jgi:PAB-dependent poly(A)-specific ribonuclease subunit 2
VTYRSPDFIDLKCMNFTSKGTREILIAGCQEQMFKVDVEKGIVVDTVSLHSNRLQHF